MTFEAILEEIQTLPVGERKRLVSLIIDTLPEQGEETPLKNRSIVEFEGVGAEMWQEVDTQAYLDQMRNEWHK